MGKERITIMIDRKTLREVDGLAKAFGRSRSVMIESLLNDAMEDTRIAAQAFTNPVIAEAIVGMFKNREVLRGFARAMGEELTEQQFQQLESLFAQAESRQSKKTKKGDK